MKNLVLSVFLAASILNSCTIDNLHPYRNKHRKIKSHHIDTVYRSVSTVNGSINGVWKWRAQYSYRPLGAYRLEPSNTGITETLNFNNNSNWAQNQNGKMVNTGTFKTIEVITPAGQSALIRMVNNLVPDTAILDNFNFDTGFISSYAVSKDSLIFYGVYSTGNIMNVASERVYIK